MHVVVGGDIYSVIMALQLHENGLKTRLIFCPSSSYDYIMPPSGVDLLQELGLFDILNAQALMMKKVTIQHLGGTQKDILFTSRKNCSYVYLQEKLLKSLLKKAREAGIVSEVEKITTYSNNHKTLSYIKNGTPSNITGDYFVCCDASLVNTFLHFEKPVHLSSQPAYWTIRVSMSEPVRHHNIYTSKCGFLSLTLLPNNTVQLITDLNAESDTLSKDEVETLLQSFLGSHVEVYRVLLKEKIYRSVSHQHMPLRFGNVFFLNVYRDFFDPITFLKPHEAIRDIMNLSWKLKGLATGIHNKQILKSYKEERLPSIENHLTLSHEVMSVIEGEDNFKHIKSFLYFHIFKFMKKVQAAFTPSHDLCNNYFIYDECKTKKLKAGTHFTKATAEELLGDAPFIKSHLIITSRGLPCVPDGWDIRHASPSSNILGGRFEMVVVRPDNVIGARFKKATQENLNKYLKITALNKIIDPQDA